MRQDNTSETEGRTAGTDVSNLGDYISRRVNTADGKTINLKLYGR